MRPLIYRIAHVSDNGLHWPIPPNIILLVSDLYTLRIWLCRRMYASIIFGSSPMLWPLASFLSRSPRTFSLRSRRLRSATPSRTVGLSVCEVMCSRTVLMSVPFSSHWVLSSLWISSANVSSSMLPMCSWANWFIETARWVLLKRQSQQCILASFRGHFILRPGV